MPVVKLTKFPRLVLEFRRGLVSFRVISITNTLLAMFFDVIFVTSITLVHLDCYELECKLAISKCKLMKCQRFIPSKILELVMISVIFLVVCIGIKMFNLKGR